MIGLLGALAAAPGVAQMAEDKTTVIGVDLLNPLVGRYSASFEQVLDGDISLFAIPTYYNVKGAIFGGLANDTDIKPEDYDVWSVTVAAGANYYVNGVAPTGVFAGAWLSPGYGFARYEGTAVKDGSTANTGTGTVLIGAGAHVGYRVIWGPVALTPRVGVSYQIAFSPFEGYRGHREQRIAAKNNLSPIVENVTSGLRFPWSIELAIAF